MLLIFHYTFRFFLFLVSLSLCLSISAQEQIYHRVEIPNLPFRIEKRRLDNAAKELKPSLNRCVVLIAHNPTGKPKTIALRRMQKSKDYLVQKYKVLPENILTVFGGFRDDGLFMLIVVFEGKPAEATAEKTIGFF